MMVQAFLQWAGTAATVQRVRAAEALAEAFVAGDLTGDDRHAAEAAMMFLLDDPSPRVRLALAHILSSFPSAPRALMRALAQDQPAVAVLVVSCSPVLTDTDLVDLVADKREEIQCAIAGRLSVSLAVGAALAEIAGAKVVAELLDNRGAALATLTLRRIAERFGDCAEIRARLLDRTDLPADLRHDLIDRVSQALAGSGLVAATIGRDRLARVTSDACRDATLHLASETSETERAALVEHLRLSGRLTPGFLMEALCRGHIDLLAAALVSVTGLEGRRVRAVLADGRAGAVAALLRRAAVPADLVGAFVDGVLLWREAQHQQDRCGPAEIARRLAVRQAEASRGSSVLAELMVLVERAAHAALRDEARAQARSMLGRLAARAA